MSDVLICGLRTDLKVAALVDNCDVGDDETDVDDSEDDDDDVNDGDDDDNSDVVGF